jgi:hypothetical protein
MKCTICNKPIILIPSATARAEIFGGKPSDYTSLFKEHPKCIVDKRSEDTKTLMHRITEQREAEKVSFPLRSQSL